MAVSKRSRILVALFSSITLFILLLSLSLKKQFYLPMDPNGTEKIVTVSKGSGVSAIGKMLEREGIIKDHRVFALLAFLEKDSRYLKAGQYKLSPAMNLTQILNSIKEGKTYYRKTTIPEGLTVKQIAATLEKNGIVKAEEFIARTTDPALLKNLALKASSFEGYLFPDTYFFSYGVGSREIIKIMFSTFRTNYNPDFHRRTLELGMTEHQVLTLASIIEEEAEVDEERRSISGVFHNRLKRGMRLQADPTVRYALGGYRGPITKKKLKTPSPYNTYLHKGLPPGPISNPGLSSIEAALYPESSPYLYFVARDNGTHKFSNTLKEHNRAVFNQRKKRAK